MMRVDVVGESSFDAGWLSLRHCYVTLPGSVCTAAVAKCCAQQIKERAALSWVCRFYPIATAAAIKQCAQHAACTRVAPLTLPCCGCGSDVELLESASWLPRGRVPAYLAVSEAIWCGENRLVYTPSGAARWYIADCLESRGQEAETRRCVPSPRRCCSSAYGRTNRVWESGSGATIVARERARTQRSAKGFVFLFPYFPRLFLDCLSCFKPSGCAQRVPTADQVAWSSLTCLQLAGKADISGAAARLCLPNSCCCGRCCSSRSCPAEVTVAAPAAARLVSETARARQRAMCALADVPGCQRSPL